MLTPPKEWPVITRTWLFHADPPTICVPDGTGLEVGGAEATAGGLISCAEVDGVGVGWADGVGTAVGVGATEAGDGTTDGVAGEGVLLNTGSTAGARPSWRDCAKAHVPTDKATIATTTQMAAARH